MLCCLLADLENCPSREAVVVGGLALGRLRNIPEVVALVEDSGTSKLTLGLAVEDEEEVAVK